MHVDHCKRRLSFLRFLAQNCAQFQISEAELAQIYAIMAKDKIFDTDSDNFLLWCKATCDMNTTSAQLLNLEDVGRFFSRKMEDGDLDVETLSPTGFELLQSYFLSSNESAGKITKIERKEL